MVEFVDRATISMIHFTDPTITCIGLLLSYHFFSPSSDPQNDGTYSSKSDHQWVIAGSLEL
jgi:hypothetical protein